MPSVADALAKNRRDALELAAKVGSARVREHLERAEADLIMRLGGISPNAAPFTAEKMRVALMHVRYVLRQLKPGMQSALFDSADDVAEAAGAGVIRHLEESERRFKGIATMPLDFDGVGMLDSAKRGARSSLLSRIATSGEEVPGADGAPHLGKLGVLDRYGAATIGHFEQVLRTSLLAQSSWEDTKNALVEKSSFLQGAPAHWAERIVRTELMNVHGAATHAAIDDLDEQIDDAVKILAATFDDRTAADSYAVHGQIRRTNEPFETWQGTMMHPPARPNDREIVVAHRIAWPIPPNLKPKSRAEIVARWHHEGRKGSPPGTPLDSTVDRKLFGLPPPPKKPARVIDPEGTEATQDMAAKAALQQQIDEGLLTQHGPMTKEEKQAKSDQIFGKIPKLPNGQFAHGLPHTNASPFWEGWSNAEQDVLSQAADAIAEANALTKVAPMNVMMHGPGLDQHEARWAVEDVINEQAVVPTLIKQGDKFFPYTQHQVVAGAHLTGAGMVDAHVVDLDDPELAAKLLAARPKDPHKLAAENILHARLSESKGTHEGGLYRGKDGVERYVKKYDDAAQAHSEAISNAIYRRLGLSAPDSVTFMHEGVLHYAHPIVEGDQIGTERRPIRIHGIDKKTAKQILDGFAADVLLGNRDVVGNYGDNILTRTDGKMHRLDNGGSLIMRGLQGRKPESWRTELLEWDGFFKPELNTYAHVLKAAGVSSHAGMKAQLTKGIKDIVKLRDDLGGWGKLVDEIAPNMHGADRDAVVSMLETRTSKLQEKLKLLNKRKPRGPKREPGKYGPPKTTFDELLVGDRREKGPSNTRTKTPTGKPIGEVGIPGTHRGDGHAALLAHATEEQRSAINVFTGGSYGTIRAAGRMTEEEFREVNKYADYKQYRRWADHIEAAFEAMPDEHRVPGRVFRGMKVPRAVANQMLAQDDKPHLPGMGSMYSTSRETGPAHDFMSNGVGDTHVLMVLDQKTGVAIETISGVSTEYEILMSGKAKFRVTERYIAANIDIYSNVLVLHMEELDD